MEKKKGKRKGMNELPMELVFLIIGLIALFIVIGLAMKGKQAFGNLFGT